MHYNELLRHMLALASMCALLFLLQLYAQVLSSSALIACWGALYLLLTAGLWQRARLRRRIFLNAYIVSASILTRLLRGGFLMLLGQAIAALFLSLFLALALLRNHAALVWSGLLLAGLALPLMTQLFARLLRAHARRAYREALSARLAAIVVGLCLYLLLLWQAYHASYPEFRAATLEQALWHMVSAQQARSELLLQALQIAAAADGLRLWLAQQLLPAPTTSLWQVLAWCVVFAQEALFVWSYLVLCRGALRLQEALSRRRSMLPLAESDNDT